VHARGRPLTHVAAVARNNAKLCWYCVVLRDTACSCSKNVATPRTNRAVIEINVFDYNVHARARTCTHDVARARACTCAVWVRL